MACGGVHELINYREGKAVFWVCLIKIGKTYAGPPLSIVLFEQDQIGYPLRVYRFPDKLIIFQPLNLLLQCFISSGFKALLFCRWWVNLGSLLRWCQLTLGSMPAISSCFQAKTSSLLRRKTLSFCLLSMFNSPSISSTSLGSCESTRKTFNSSTGGTYESNFVILGSKIISITPCSGLAPFVSVYHFNVSPLFRGQTFCRGFKHLCILENHIQTTGFEFS